jgi:hypothetical protein
VLVGHLDYLGYLEHKVTRDQLELQDQQEQVVLRVIQDRVVLTEILVFQEHQDLKASVVHRVSLELQVNLVLPDQVELMEVLVHQVLKDPEEL